MDYIKFAPRKYKIPPTFLPTKTTKNPPKNKSKNTPLENKKSPHQNQNLCFRRIFVFFKGAFNMIQ